jgi:hypothetical protein
MRKLNVIIISAGNIFTAFEQEVSLLEYEKRTATARSFNGDGVQFYEKGNTGYIVYLPSALAVSLFLNEQQAQGEV